MAIPVTEERTLKFVPTWRVTHELRVLIEEHLIAREPMLFGADMQFASEKGGLLTSMFLGALDALGIDGVGKHITIDSRVHMLKPGWYPCIPGWHLDLIPRDDNNQPNIDNPPEGDTHWLMIFGDCSCTQFLGSPIELRRPLPDEVVYNSFNTQINREVHRGTVHPVPIEHGQLIQFGPKDLHRGVAAHKDGWRFFIRASATAHREPANQIRQNANVYVPIADLEKGW
jgi:hypothetical protein